MPDHGDGSVTKSVSVRRREIEISSAGDVDSETVITLRSYLNHCNDNTEESSITGCAPSEQSEQKVYDFHSCFGPSQSNEITMGLHPVSPIQNREPMRGVLRAVSSLTITDIEAIEDGIHQLRKREEKPIAFKRKKSKSPKAPVSSSDSSPNVPVRSPSTSIKPAVKPRRGNGASGRRRSKSQGQASDEEDSIVGNTCILTPPFSLDRDAEKKDYPLRPRRKSIDLLPSLPRRTNSIQQNLDEPSTKPLRKACEKSGSTLNRLMGTLDLKGSLKPLKSQCSVGKEESSYLAKSATETYEESSCPSSSNERPVSFDRRIETMIVGSPNPATDIQDVEQEGRKVNRLGFEDPRRNALDAINPSPYKVREFVISLDDWEDKKLQKDTMIRRKSYDSLPTPPRRFLDEFGTADSDSADDEDFHGNFHGTDGRRHSYGDIESFPASVFDAMFTEDGVPRLSAAYLEELNDQHEATESPSRGGIGLSSSYRSNASRGSSKSPRSNNNKATGDNRAFPKARRRRARTNAHSPGAETAFSLDRSTRSHQGYAGSEGGFNLDMSSRSDYVPTLPRRRLNSDSSDNNEENTSDIDDIDDLEWSPSTRDAMGPDIQFLVKPNASCDVLPSAPQRIPSVASKAPSFAAKPKSSSPQPAAAQRTTPIEEDFIDDTTDDEEIVPLARTPSSDRLPSPPKRENSDPRLYVSATLSSDEESLVAT